MLRTKMTIDKSKILYYNEGKNIVKGKPSYESHV